MPSDEGFWSSSGLPSHSEASYLRNPLTCFSNPINLQALHGVTGLLARLPAVTGRQALAPSLLAAAIPDLQGNAELTPTQMS